MERQVGDELGDSGVPFVVLDFNPDVLEEAREKKVLYIDGNGTEDGSSRRPDSTAPVGSSPRRTPIPDKPLHHTVGAQSSGRSSSSSPGPPTPMRRRKLRLAGADRVVEPYSTAGKEMAKLVLKPQVAAFLDAASATGSPDLRFEEIIVNTASGRTGQSIKQIDVRSKTTR